MRVKHYHFWVLPYAKDIDLAVSSSKAEFPYLQGWF